jgi:7-cyano-7-deazaguanine reductase
MSEKVIETPTDRIEGTVLGQRIAAPKTYSPDILVPVPRVENRTQYGITGEEFIGYDTWNMYEVSFLLDNGFPVTLVGKLIYRSNTPFIVESKSVKLYFNSFNMEKMGPTVTDAIERFEATVRSDIAEKVGADVDDVEFRTFDFDDSLLARPPIDDIGHMDLFLLIDAEKMQFTDYSENPDILEECDDTEPLLVYTNNIRSNCKITHQPDWAVIFIEMYPNGKNVTHESLAKYLVSLRDESHFHEEVCEMVYKRLWEKFQPEDLSVAMLYTRRGGISICPQRCSNDDLLHYNLMDPKTLCEKTLHE